MFLEGLVAPCQKGDSTNAENGRNTDRYSGRTLYGCVDHDEGRGTNQNRADICAEILIGIYWFIRHLSRLPGNVRQVA